MKNKLFLPDKKGFVELLEVFGNDLTIVNAARVSFHRESHLEPVTDNTGNVVDHRLSTRDGKLVDYLAKHQHSSPFFHPIIRMRIKMPIFVTREWWRHTVGFTRNEVSRRYVTDEPECFIPDELRMRDENAKQGSQEMAVQGNTQQVQAMQTYCKKSLEYYNTLIATDVCPEQARMILPQSMYTEYIETASLGGYARLVKLRVHASSQREIQKYAHFVDELLKHKFPVAWNALMKY